MTRSSLSARRSVTASRQLRGVAIERHDLGSTRPQPSGRVHCHHAQVELVPEVIEQRRRRARRDDRSC